MIIFGGRMKFEFLIWLILLSPYVTTDRGILASSSYNLYYLVGSSIVLLSCRMIKGMWVFAFKSLFRYSNSLYSSPRIWFILLVISLTRVNLILSKLVIQLVNFCWNCSIKHRVISFFFGINFRNLICWCAFSKSNTYSSESNKSFLWYLACSSIEKVEDVLFSMRFRIIYGSYSILCCIGI